MSNNRETVFELINRLARHHQIIITDWVTPESFMAVFPYLTRGQAIDACYNLSVADYDDAIDRDVRYHVLREAIERSK